MLHLHACTSGLRVSAANTIFVRDRRAHCRPSARRRLAAPQIVKTDTAMRNILILPATSRSLPQPTTQKTTTIHLQSCDIRSKRAIGHLQP